MSMGLGEGVLTFIHFRQINSFSMYHLEVCVPEHGDVVARGVEHPEALQPPEGVGAQGGDAAVGDVDLLKAPQPPG